MKRLGLILFGAVFQLVILTSAADAQTGATASQTIQLQLQPVISLSFSNSQSNNGAPVLMDFSTPASFQDGVVSGTQELKIRSNKTFMVTVNTDAGVLSGSGAGAPAMPVANTLFLTVEDHNTGGTINQAFSKNYNTLSQVPQELVANGQLGEDQRLVLAYKAKPGFGYPAGQYAVGVVYTATLP